MIISVALLAVVILPPEFFSLYYTTGVVNWLLALVNMMY